MSSQGGDKQELEELKVFVGGISWKLDSRDLKDLFKKYGAVEAQVMEDKLTARSRGFGFVSFSTSEQVDEAIARMHEKEIEGRKISVVRAIPQDQTAPGAPAGGRARSYGSRDYPPRYGSGRGYEERGSDRYSERYSERPAARGYDSYDRGAYERRDTYARDPYPARDSYSRYAPEPAAYASYDAYDPPYDNGYGKASYGYEDRIRSGGPERVSYGHDDRMRTGGVPDRSRGAYASRPGPYDRPVGRREDFRR